MEQHSEAWSAVVSPKQLLELWRERWGKGEDGQPDRLYEKGSVHSWLHSLAKAGLWEKPMMSAVVIFLSVIALALLSKIE